MEVAEEVEEGLMELGFGLKIVEDGVVAELGLEPEMGLGAITGGVCFTG